MEYKIFLAMLACVIFFMYFIKILGNKREDADVILLLVSGIIALVLIPQIIFAGYSNYLESVNPPYLQDTESIIYKGIDLSSEEYFAIGEDGSIYKIEKREWANLDVPVIARAK
jgi:hypothetical protein